MKAGVGWLRRGNHEIPESRSAVHEPSDGAIPNAIGAYRLQGGGAGYGRPDLQIARREGKDFLGGDYTVLPLSRDHLGRSGGESAVIALGRKAMGVRHPTLLRVCDVVSDGGWLGIVSEHCRGRSLASLRGSAAVLDPGPGERPAILTLCAVLLEALHDVHELFADQPQRGHGFMGPESVVITARGDLKVAGVGLPIPGPEALQPIRWGRRRTVNPADQDPKLAPLSDQFAVGLILLRLVTGRGFDIAIEEATGEERSDALRWTIGSVQLEDPILPVLLRLLANEPGHRFPDSGTAARQLRHLAGATGPGTLSLYLRRLVSNRPPERSVADVTLEEMPLEELDLLDATDPGRPVPGAFDDEEPSRVVSRATLLAPPSEANTIQPLGAPPQRRWTDFGATDSGETELDAPPEREATATGDGLGPIKKLEVKPAKSQPAAELPTASLPPPPQDDKLDLTTARHPAAKAADDSKDSMLQGSSALLDPEPALAKLAAPPPLRPRPSRPPGPPAPPPNIAVEPTATGQELVIEDPEWAVSGVDSRADGPDGSLGMPAIPAGQSRPGRTVPYSPAFVPKSTTWRRSTPDLGPVPSTEPQSATQGMPQPQREEPPIRETDPAQPTPEGASETREMPDAASVSMAASSELSQVTASTAIVPPDSTADLPRDRRRRRQGRRRSPAERKKRLRKRLLKRYAPLLVAATAFAVIALLVLIAQMKKQIDDRPSAPAAEIDDFAG